MTKNVGPEWRAEFSPDGVYRYVLRRDIGNLHGSRGTVVFVMLNPSTANAQKDDPTIRRCISFAQQQNASYLEVVNLFAFRSHEPDDLRTAIDPVGPLNDVAIRAAVRSADLVICAWGAEPFAKERAAKVRRLIEYDCGKVAHALALTKDEQPRHPLYLKGSLKPRPIEELRGGNHDDPR